MLLYPTSVTWGLLFILINNFHFHFHDRHSSLIDLLRPSCLFFIYIINVFWSGKLSSVLFSSLFAHPLNCLLISLTSLFLFILYSLHHSFLPCSSRIFDVAFSSFLFNAFSRSLCPYHNVGQASLKVYLIATSRGSRIIFIQREYFLCAYVCMDNSIYLLVKYKERWN